MGFEAYRKQRTLFTIERTALQLLAMSGPVLVDRPSERYLATPH